MRTIQVDEEVYRALEERARGFGRTPNIVLREVLELEPNLELKPESPPVQRPRITTSRKRGKAPKANLRDLVRVGILREGQQLFLHDYQGQRVNEAQAKIRGNDLEFEGERMSMSALTKQLMQREGYQSDSYRGPQFWFTAEGKSVKELWAKYQHSAANR